MSRSATLIAMPIDFRNLYIYTHIHTYEYKHVYMYIFLGGSFVAVDEHLTNVRKTLQALAFYAA